MRRLLVAAPAALLLLTACAADDPVAERRTAVASVTDTATYEQVVDLLVPVAVQGSEADLRAVTDHVVAVALADKETEAKAKACHDSRAIHESCLADGSLTRFILTADAEGAATIRAILSSPLAGPTPDETGPDPRTPTQRRYDAVMTVLGRGMSSPQGTPTTTKAKIFLTIPFTALAFALAGTFPGTLSTGWVAPPTARSARPVIRPTRSPTVRSKGRSPTSRPPRAPGHRSGPSRGWVAPSPGKG